MYANILGALNQADRLGITIFSYPRKLPVPKILQDLIVVSFAMVPVAITGMIGGMIAHHLPEPLNLTAIVITSIYCVAVFSTVITLYNPERAIPRAFLFSNPHPHIE